MKKKVIIAIIVIILLVLLVPVPTRLKDGGTVEYKSLIYTISKVHKLNHNSESGYNDGWIIKILGKQIYNNVPKNNDGIYEEKATEKNYFKTIDNVTLEMNIPNEWKYEELPRNENNDFYKFALKLYKSEDSKNTILYFYHNPFGVCGTGRTDKKICLNSGSEANIGYYDNIEEWSDISFYELNPNIALINYGLEGSEAEEVLDFVKTIRIINTDKNEMRK